MPRAWRQTLLRREAACNMDSEVIARSRIAFAMMRAKNASPAPVESTTFTTGTLKCSTPLLVAIQQPRAPSVTIE
jgi:hypothetical protein